MRSRKFFVLLGFLTALSFILGSHTAQSLDQTRGWHSANQIGPGTMTGPIVVTTDLRTERLSIGSFYEPYAIMVKQGGLLIGDVLTQEKPQSSIPKGNLVNTIDSNGNSGLSNSIIIGNDGLPVISYFEKTNGDLKFLKCINQKCSSVFNNLSTLDRSGNVGNYSSIIIGPNGFPTIAYYDDTNKKIKILLCNDEICNTYSISTIDSATTDVGRYMSMTIHYRFADSQGFPMIVSQANTPLYGKVLHVLYCASQNCFLMGGVIYDYTGGNRDSGYYPSVAMGVDNLPIVAFIDIGNLQLKVLKCTIDDCYTGGIVTTLESLVTSQSATSIAIGNDGLPVISFINNGKLKLYKCSNIDCTAGWSRILDTVTNAFYFAPISIGPDGFPAIAYSDFNNGAVKLYKCWNINCTSGTTTTLATESPGIVPVDISMTTGTDGNPIISYHIDNTFSSGSLKVIKCGSPGCLPYWTRR